MFCSIFRGGGKLQVRGGRKEKAVGISCVMDEAAARGQESRNVAVRGAFTFSKRAGGGATRQPGGGVVEIQWLRREGKEKEGSTTWKPGKKKGQVPDAHRRGKGEKEEGRRLRTAMLPKSAVAKARAKETNGRLNKEMGKHGSRRCLLRKRTT